MKEITLLDGEAYTIPSHYRSIEQGIYRDLKDEGDTCFRMPIGFKLDEGECMQYPLEDILDEYYCMYPNSSYPRDLITLLFWQENLKISKGLSVSWARRYLIKLL